MNEQQANRRFKQIKLERADLDEQLNTASANFRMKKLGNEKLLAKMKSSNNTSNSVLGLVLLVLIFLAPWWVTAVAAVLAYYLSYVDHRTFVQRHAELDAELEVFSKQIARINSQIEALEDEEHKICRDLGIDVDDSE